MAARQLSEFMRHLRRVLERQDAGGISDGELVKRYVQQRDETAFEALLRRHGPMVFGVCRRVLHNQHDAEDAFQATFLILVSKASSLRSPSTVGNWLYGVAYRTALHAREAAGKRRAKEAEMPAKLPIAEDIWADLRPALDLELERLPDKYRSVIVLCDLEGKTRKEAARHLGRTEGTVASRLARGRVMLAKRLARHGLTVSGGALAAVLCQNASASVPASAVSSTIKAATLFAARGAATSVIPAKVAALTEGVLKTMLLSKLKIAMMVMLLMLITSSVGVGVGLLMPGAQAKSRAETNREQPAKPAMPSRFLKGDFRIADLDWSSDGKTLATVTVDVVHDDGKALGREKIKGTAVRLWDLKSGSVKRTLADDEPKKYWWNQAGVALSPDGKTVAAATTGKFEEDPTFCGWLVLWDAGTGQVRFKLKHVLLVQCIAFSQDGKTVATGTGGNVNRDFETVKVWDARTGKLVRTMETTDKMAVKVALAPDGKTLGAVLQEGDALAEVVLWDAADGKRLQTLPDSDGIPAIAFSSDGKALVGVARNKLRVWDVETGKTVQASDIKTDLDFSAKSWSAFALSPDSKTVAIAGKQAGRYVVTLWDVMTAKQTKTLEGPEGFIWTLAFSRDGRTLASGEDGKICLWDFDEKGNPEPAPTASPQEPGAKEAKAADKDGDNLQRNWEGVSSEIDGIKGPPVCWALTKDAGGFNRDRHKGGPDDVLFDFKYKLDPAAKPKAIDLVPDQGPAKGKTLRGIYSLEGDELKICYVRPSIPEPEKKKRPSEFATKKGSGYVLLVLRPDALDESVLDKAGFDKVELEYARAVLEAVRQARRSGVAKEFKERWAKEMDKEERLHLLRRLALGMDTFGDLPPSVIDLTEARLAAAPAPALEGTSWYNAAKPLEWKDLRGKVVLLNFMSDTCVPCVENLPKVKALHQQFQDKGLVVICVHHKEVAEGASKVSEFLKKQEITFPVVVDTGKTFERYQIPTMPTYLLVNKAGKVVLRGAAKFLRTPTAEEIKELLNQ